MLVSGSSHYLSLAFDLISFSILCNIVFSMSGGIIVGFNSSEAKILIYSNNESVSPHSAYKEVCTQYILV